MTTERFGVDARVTHAGASGDIRHICGTVIAVEGDERRIRLDDGGLVTWKVERLRAVSHARSEESDANKILAVLNEYDLENACHKSWPNGTAVDYMPEAIILLQRVVERPLTAEYVRDVWLVMFATNDVVVRPGGTAGHRGRHGVVVRTQIDDMPMRPEFAAIADRVNKLFPQKITGVDR